VGCVDRTPAVLTGHDQFEGHGYLLTTPVWEGGRWVVPERTVVSAVPSDDRPTAGRERRRSVAPVITPAVPRAEPRRRPHDRKQRILVAARELFVEKGYPNVTMAQIAEHVGITASALYRHFSNKTALLQQVVVENFAWLDEPAPEVGFDELVEVVIALVIDRPNLFDLWAHEIRYLPDAELRDLRRRMRAWNRSLGDALRERRPGLDQGQEELMAWAILSLMSCLGRRAMHAPIPLRLPAVRAAMHAITLTNLLPADGPETALREQRGLRAASIRERVLLAAFEQFAQRGYAETSMASLGAAANVTGQNLYGYFESKADVLRAVLERGTHALWLGLDQALASSATASEALDRLLASYIPLAGSWAFALEDPTCEEARGETTLAVQREYIAEWVALLLQVVPRLSQRQARLRVQLAFFMVSDLQAVPHLTRSAGFRENLARMVSMVLLDRSVPEADDA
jgi:AcrR family transcriptional regulator